MLYVLEDPQGRVAVLRLPDEGPMVRCEGKQGCRRAQCLRRRTHVAGVAIADVRVVGASGLCGPDEEYPAAARLISDGLARSANGHRAHTAWTTKPADWLERCAAADVGWFPVPRPLAELARKNYLPRPRFPSDPPGAYDHVLAWRFEVRPSRLFPVRNVGPLTAPQDRTAAPCDLKKIA